MEEPVTGAPLEEQAALDTGGGATVPVVPSGPSGASSLGQRLRATVAVVGDRFNNMIHSQVIVAGVFDGESNPLGDEESYAGIEAECRSAA